LPDIGILSYTESNRWGDVRMRRYTFRLAVVILAAMIVAGCNTVQGVGRDIEKAGETIREVAE